MHLIIILIVLLFTQLSLADGHQVQKQIMQAAIKQGVDPYIMAAICYKESKFKYFYNLNDGGSPSHGPCQIKAIAAKQVGIDKQYLTTDEAILVAVLYYKYKFEKCKDMRAAVAAYNTGTCKYKQKKGGYTDSVMGYYNALRRGEVVIGQ